MANKLVLEGEVIAKGVAWEEHYFYIGKQELDEAIMEFLGEPVEAQDNEDMGSYRHVFRPVRITVELLDDGQDTRQMA